MYNHLEIEKKWQAYWEKNKTFRAEIDKNKKKYYVLDMFPYPSGAGLHVGHPEGQTASDIICRKRRMESYNVLHPMGWDAFGLPAENYAIKTGIHPRISTDKNINTFRKQEKSLGMSFDWDREIDTSASEYYKWTQWIFKQLYLSNLAYEKEMNMNWCDKCRIVVANEEVENGVHERCENPVRKRVTKQWMLKITAYADRLLSDLDELNWSDSILEMQRNWIGKSMGANVSFKIDGSDENIEVYTTRPDTLFGCTYMVLAPEHPLSTKICSIDQKETVESYIKQSLNKSERERKIAEKEKTGVFTGAYAINPVNSKKIPIWIADYVLIDYGTGAIMAVPAHDERDNEFAKKFDLEIIDVIKSDNKKDNEVITDGIMINSDFLNGLDTKTAKEKMVSFLEKNNYGEGKVNFKLRDWVFTRQRYWGEPIPLIHSEDGKIYPLADSQLPLLLPEVDKYEPTEDGQSPLAQNEDWVNVNFYLNDKREAIVIDDASKFSGEVLKGRRETSTMPNWAGSSWYWIRYQDPHNDKEFVSREAENYWGAVDLYVGGAEHAVLHLLYARFWHKFLYDKGFVSTKEPFTCLKNQGMILAYSYQNEFGKYYHPDEVIEKDGKFYAKDDNKELKAQIEKMSKSKNNVVNPDDVINEYGADTLRVYEMFMGPFDQIVAWDMKGVAGIRRFLDRVWRLQDLLVEVGSSENELKALHQMLKKVSEDTENFKFNTAISAMMVFVNDINKLEKISRTSLEKLVLVLSPYAPHIAEEIWNKLGNLETLSYEKWPQYDEKYLVEDQITIAVQINGKLRGNIEVSTDSSKEEVFEIAKQNQNVARYLAEGEIRKEIYVPQKLVNFVVA